MSDRDQLKRDCADALEALLRENRVDGLHNTGESIRMVSPAYKLHGEQIQAATWFREDNTITWHLIHVLEKLEQGMP
jgi:hypothetical protein